MKTTNSFIKYFNVACDAKQFTFGFLIGIIISLVYNSAMYLSVTNTSNQQAIDEFKELDNFFKVKNNTLFETNIAYDFKSFDLRQPSPCGYARTGPRILCTVFTHKKNFLLKAKYVEETWGKRCDKTIFMSGMLNETEKQLYTHMDIVYLNVTDTNRLNLTTKTIQTILYANNYLIDSFDWILKADDDTYVIMENLRQFLSDKCADDMTYYGFRYKPLKPDTFEHDFNSGGAGYVISNNAVRKFSQNYAESDSYCRNLTGSEDVDIAKCLDEIQIQPGDSRDEFGLERFHPLSYESMWNLTPKKRTFHHARFPIKKVCTFL